MYKFFLSFKALLTLLCVLSYAVQTYLGLTVPAYQAMFWCAVVFLVDIAEIIRERENGYR